MKQPKRETDKWTPITEVKNVWNYTSIPPYAFMRFYVRLIYVIYLQTLSVPQNRLIMFSDMKIKVRCS